MLSKRTKVTIIKSKTKWKTTKKKMSRRRRGGAEEGGGGGGEVRVVHIMIVTIHQFYILRRKIQKEFFF